VEPTSAADARQRTHLEARRVYLISQVNALRDHALELWRQARAAAGAGDTSYTLDHLAMDAEEACFRVNRALLAIDDELGEGEDAN
jgi:hypothetical protein